MAHADWYRLDNVGKFYASQAGRSGQTVFRFSATLSQAVDPAVLQQALDQTVAQYPGFNVKLRSGLFWHYLEPADTLPQVEPETLPICANLHSDVDSVLFRVSYYGSRINMEVSHIISDGRGTLQFFQTLLNAYGNGGSPSATPHTAEPISPERRTEDSYSANFERSEAGSTPSEKVYHLRGWKNNAEPSYLEYQLSASAVHQAAKERGVSVTSLIIAAVIQSIRQTMRPEDHGRAIRMDVPVDLRELFGSETLRNFFGLAYVSFTPKDNPCDLTSLAQNVQAQLIQATQPEHIKRRMNAMIKLEKNPALRLAPLFIKDAVLFLADRLSTREVTTTVSSLGRITTDPTLEGLVENINVLTSTRGLNFIACTYGDVLSIGISTVYVRYDIIRNFCRIFTDLGIPGTLSINKTAQEVDAGLKQAEFEGAVAKALAETGTQRQARKQQGPQKQCGRVGHWALPEGRLS